MILMYKLDAAGVTFLLNAIDVTNAFGTQFLEGHKSQSMQE